MLQRGHHFRALSGDFFRDSSVKLFLLLFPIGEAILILLAQRPGTRFLGVGVGHSFINHGLQTGNGYEHRFVKKPLQNPDQHQEIDDLEKKCRPA
jgi:hypothetical protein